MSGLSERSCRPCGPGETPLDRAAAERLAVQLHADWRIDEAGRAISRVFRFGDYYETIAFVNGVALVAHRQDHHPDMRVSYNRCEVSYSTHSIGGLSENDFICAARIDRLCNI